jgi:epoxide hydrolase
MSLAIAQSDSPAGTAAWIVEKFRQWSDCDGDVERVFTKDQLLTNVMFYWASNSIASAARIYYEDRVETGDPDAAVVEVPVGVAVFPKENLARATHMGRDPLHEHPSLDGVLDRGSPSRV